LLHYFLKKIKKNPEQTAKECRNQYKPAKSSDSIYQSKLNSRNSAGEKEEEAKYHSEQTSFNF